MALNLEKIPKNLLRDIMDNRECTREDIANMSLDEAFSAWCTWQGFIGWAQIIKLVLDTLREAEGGS